jgi:hypothetical protein
MPHQDFNGLVVRVSMRIEIVHYGKINSLPDRLGISSRSRGVKLANAAIVDSMGR